MIKILSIFGTRPEAIKMAPVILELMRHPNRFTSRVCVTAQHRQMLDQVLNLFEIRPDYDLDIMRPDQDLYDVTSSVLLGLKPVLATERPDMVLVHGDTTTTMTAALAAYYSRIPLGHVEAGLRTHNKFAPFPEEINRQVCGVLADLHFAPTDAARLNLMQSGVPATSIHVTGNTVVDALLAVSSQIASDLSLQNSFAKQFGFLNADKRLILVTGHRRENFGEGFENICHALADLAAHYPDCDILYPVHLNPNVQEPVKRLLGSSTLSNIHLIEPVD
ncbi:MAG: UDP-N-acetylglucosamine 2-epimerase (non-hydrolyzing), partial [Pedobacter sp.]